MIDIEALKKIDIQEMQQTLPDVVGSIQTTGEPCIITCDSESVAVVVRHAEFFFLVGAYFAIRRSEDSPMDSPAN